MHPPACSLCAYLKCIDPCGCLILHALNLRFRGRPIRIAERLDKSILQSHVAVQLGHDVGQPGAPRVIRARLSQS